MDKKFPGLFKHSSRQSSSTSSMDKLIKKRNVPQKLPSGKRWERLTSRAIEHKERCHHLNGFDKDGYECGIICSYVMFTLFSPCASSDRIS